MLNNGHKHRIKLANGYNGIQVADQKITYDDKYRTATMDGVDYETYINTYPDYDIVIDFECKTSTCRDYDGISHIPEYWFTPEELHTLEELRCISRHRESGIKISDDAE